MALCRVVLTFIAATTLFLRLARAAEPCVSTTCTEWVHIGDGSQRSLVYRTYPLDARNENITRAFILVHGAGRDADNYFRTAVAAAFLARALDNTIVLAPHFSSNDSHACEDALQPNEVNWSCSGNSWRSGGASLSNAHLTSYDFMDELLRKLARKDVFPNLKAIVLAGHSAGGQYVTRYEMSNRVHESLGVSVTYVVANPSSYAYLDASRPSTEGSKFQRFAGAASCPAYDRWPYGLEDRAGYTAALTNDQLKKQLAARPVIYLLGEIDILPLGGFDSSCGAMAQGPTRRARGENYARYVDSKYDAQHKVVIVPLCGHNARCMFTADTTLPLIFPK